MSWSSDIRCLHCDGKLPLYRKITNGQFCCAAHRKLYWQEQERLGVERLHQTHDSLRAFRPPEGAEAILGRPIPEKAEEKVPPPSGVIAPQVPRPAGPTAFLLASLPPYADCYEATLSPQVPLWAPQIAGAAEDEIPLAGPIRIDAMPRPHWPLDRLESMPEPLETGVRMRMPLRAAAPLAEKIAAGKMAKIPMAAKDSRVQHAAEPLPAVVEICRRMSLAAAPMGYPEVHPAEEENVPRAESLLALTKFVASDIAASAAHREPWGAGPFYGAQKAYLPLLPAPVAKPSMAGLRPLSIEQVPLVHGTWIDNLRALGSEGDAPQYVLSTPALRPRLKLAAGSRYTVATRDAATSVAPIEPKNLQPVNAIAIPERAAPATVSASRSSAAAMPAPGAAGPVPLALLTPSEPVSPQSVSPVNLPQPLRTQPMRPASRLEPLDEKPIADFIAAAPVPAETPDQPGPAAAFVPQASGENRAVTPWMHAKDFWKYAPRDLKLLAFGIPILLALALQPSLKKVPFAAPKEVGGIQRGIQQNFETRMNQQWLNVRQQMVDRAAIALDEDFRAGLDDWTSRGGTTEWAFDATGFVRPGPLALYRPSLNLTDYQLQFLGMIDKKALSWVVRAADFDDYYVVKLEVLKPGPLPAIGITRYAVIHGVAENRADTPVFVDAREDMLYRVRMDIHGDTFSLTVQGQMVDSWSEPRLRKGGVGFFTARGEASRLRWVQVTHQYDMLGRLCAYLAPYNIPSTSGGWQP